MARTRVHPALALLLAAALALAAAAPPQPAPRARRQLADDASLQPVDDAAEGVEGAAAGREKRKFEGVAQASFGIKNAVLGLVFGKINSIIDSKTRLVETLDRNNIEKNRALGIEPPPSGVSSFGTVFGQLLGPALQVIGPHVQAVSGLLGGLSGSSAGASGGGAGGAGGGAGGGGLGSVLSLVSSLSGSSSGGGAGATVETIDSDEDDDSS